MNQKDIKADRDIFILRRNSGPYIWFPAIVLPVLIFGAITTGDWKGIMFAMAIFSVIWIGMTWIQNGYRIWWKDNALFQRASNGDITTIKIDEIQKLRRERSDAQTLISMQRPALRITVYGETTEGSKIIDISLKHFKSEDIRKLMKIIHECRSDIEMLKGWT